MQYRRALLLLIGIGIVCSFWLPWMHLVQSEAMNQRAVLNGIELIAKLNAYHGSSLRLPMFTGIINIFYAVPIIGAGLSFAVMMNAKALYKVFAVLLPGILNVFWMITYLIIVQNGFYLDVFDPLGEVGFGFLLLCPLTIGTMILGLIHIDQM